MFKSKRKRRHLNYMYKYLLDLRYDTLNKTLTASENQFDNKSELRAIKNNCLLIRKYQRRWSLLKF